MSSIDVAAALGIFVDAEMPSNGSTARLAANIPAGTAAAFATGIAAFANLNAEPIGNAAARSTI